MFIVNLAIADLSCASLVMPASLVSLWFDRWVFGSFLCDVACFLNYSFIIVSMLSLALISVDRYIYVVHPFRYVTHMTHRRAIASSVCTWVVGFTFALAPPIMEWVIYSNAEVICAVNWESSHNQILAYTASAFVICFMLPIFVMAYCNIRIYQIANNHARRMRPPITLGQIASQPTEQTNGLVPQKTSTGRPKSPPQLKSQGNKLNSESCHSSKARRSILVMVLAYLICNTPFSLVKLIKVVKASNEAVPFYVNTAASWFGFVNPCCNPIIYSIMREDFRAAFVRILPKSVTKCLRINANLGPGPSHIIGPSNGTNSPNTYNITMDAVLPGQVKQSPVITERSVPHEENNVVGSKENVKVNNNAGI